MAFGIASGSPGPPHVIATSEAAMALGIAVRQPWPAPCHCDERSGDGTRDSVRQPWPAPCHCEERSDEAISVVQAYELPVRCPGENCFVALLFAITWARGPRFSGHGYQPTRRTPSSRHETNIRQGPSGPAAIIAVLTASGNGNSKNDRHQSLCRPAPHCSGAVWLGCTTRHCGHTSCQTGWGGACRFWQSYR